LVARLGCIDEKHIEPNSTQDPVRAHQARASADAVEIVPDCVRRIAGQSFAFVPRRLLRDGFLARLCHAGPEATALALSPGLLALRGNPSFSLLTVPSMSLIALKPIC
jgi:hypothetical protein